MNFSFSTTDDRGFKPKHSSQILKTNPNASLSCLNETDIPQSFRTFMRALCAPLAMLINFTVVNTITPTTHVVSSLVDEHFLLFTHERRPCEVETSRCLNQYFQLKAFKIASLLALSDNSIFF